MTSYDICLCLTYFTQYDNIAFTSFDHQNPFHIALWNSLLDIIKFSKILNLFSFILRFKLKPGALRGTPFPLLFPTACIPAGWLRGRHCL